MSGFIGFDEEFRHPILRDEKTATLRYKDKNRLPDVGDVVRAVVSHDEGAFAELRVTEVSPMTVREVVDAEFDAHQNYSSVEHFNSRMDQYYDVEFTEDMTVYLIRFEVVDTKP